LVDKFKPNSLLRIDYGVRLADERHIDTRVIGTAVHPSYKNSFVYGGDAEKNEVVDMAVIVVENLPPDIAIARINHQSLAQGREVIFTGYGCEKLPNHMSTEPGSAVVVEALTDFEKTLRLKFKKIAFAGYQGSAGILQNQNPNNNLDANASAGEVFSGCPGDSGSAVYVLEQGSLQVVGVNSYVGYFSSAFMRMDDAGPFKLATCFDSVFGNFSISRDNISIMCE
jgi:hypothetical protein